MNRILGTIGAALLTVGLVQVSGAAPAAATSTPTAKAVTVRVSVSSSGRQGCQGTLRSAQGRS